MRIISAGEDPVTAHQMYRSLSTVLQIPNVPDKMVSSGQFVQRLKRIYDQSEGKSLHGAGEGVHDGERDLCVALFFNENILRL
jgi:hypothetical protein